MEFPTIISNQISAPVVEISILIYKFKKEILEQNTKLTLFFISQTNRTYIIPFLDISSILRNGNEIHPCFEKNP